MTIAEQIRASVLLAIRKARRQKQIERIERLTPEDRSAGAPPREKVAARTAPEKG